MGALGLVKRARADFEAAIKLDAGALDGAAYTSLGALYYQVPGWPVGFGGSLHRDLTGAQNIRFIARVYGVDTASLSAFVEDFAELGMNFNEPVRNYSSGMRARLNFGMSMGIRFDTYLLDEFSAVGDAGFKKKSQMVFDDRMSKAGVLMVTHSERLMRSLCTAGAVLENGRLTYYDDVNDAIEQHARNTLGDDYKRSKEFMDE